MDFFFFFFFFQSSLNAFGGLMHLLAYIMLTSLLLFLLVNGIWLPAYIMHSFTLIAGLSYIFV